MPTNGKSDENLRFFNNLMGHKYGGTAGAIKNIGFKATFEQYVARIIIKPVFFQLPTLFSECGTGNRFYSTLEPHRAELCLGNNPRTAAAPPPSHCMPIY